MKKNADLNDGTTTLKSVAEMLKNETAFVLSLKNTHEGSCKHALFLSKEFLNRFCATDKFSISHVELSVAYGSDVVASSMKSGGLEFRCRHYTNPDDDNVCLPTHRVAVFTDEELAVAETDIKDAALFVRDMSITARTIL